jgi:uncharacterized protein (DUF885 family)
MHRVIRAVAAGALLLSVACPVRAATAPTADARFTRLADAFLDGWLGRRPQFATRLGLHRWDDTLVPVTGASVASDVAWLAGLQQELAAIPRRQLTFEHAQEAAVLGARLARERLELEGVRRWEQDPGWYLDMIAGGIQSLIDRPAAPVCERTRALAGRLAMVPEILRAATINLRDPVRPAVEAALPRYAATVALYRGPVAAQALACRDVRLQAALGEADSAAIAAIARFTALLRDDVLPRARANFALGDSLYRAKLAADEMEDTPLDSLLARGRAELDATRARIDSLAQRIAPGRGVQAALDQLAAGSPSADSLVPFVAARLTAVRAFLQTHALLTLPDREHLAVRPAPATQRGTSFASMDSPGPWEDPLVDQAWLNVTPVEPDWPAARAREHLSFYNPWAAENLVIHEALPGHYWQALTRRAMRSHLRQALPCASNVEGWAHYCEQMMVEQGWGGGDPRVALAQSVAACQRLGRLVVGISLHARGMTLEDAEQFFEQRCLMAPANAEREARRGILDPTYGVYVLGKWRLLALRDEVRARLGPRFDLRAFHDAVLREGPSPLPVVRAGVLHALTGEPWPPSTAGATR